MFIFFPLEHVSFFKRFLMRIKYISINERKTYSFQRSMSKFLILGILALMWVAVWQIMVSDSPETDNHISNAERELILESLRAEHTSHVVSWLCV